MSTGVIETINDNLENFKNCSMVFIDMTLNMTLKKHLLPLTIT